MQHTLQNSAVIFFFLCAPLAVDANVLRVNLKQALDNHMVQVSATAASLAYNSRGLKLNIENRTGSDLRITMDIGMIFRAADTTIQDLVLAGEEFVMVAPFKSGSVDVQTFCAKSRARAPKPGMSFSFLKMTDETLTAVLHYIKNNRLFDDLGQRAVWAVTDEKNLSGVYDPYREPAARKLVEHMAGITRWPVPEYYTVRGISHTPEAPVMEPKSLKIYALYEETLTEPKKLTLGVYNEAGERIRTVFENRSFGKTGHRWKVEFEATSMSPGRYYIRLTEGAKVLRETMVRVE